MVSNPNFLQSDGFQDQIRTIFIPSFTGGNII